MILDIILFRAINELAGRLRVLDLAGIFFAKYLIMVMGVGLIVFLCTYWKKFGAHFFLQTLVKVVLIVTIAYGVNIMIGAFKFRPRPFVALPGVHQLIEKSPAEKSFPSGHATVAFALAFAIHFLDKKLGRWFILAAALVGLGRIFVGVHYPLDIIGGLTLGVITAYILGKALPTPSFNKA